MLPEDDKGYAVETCRSILSVFSVNNFRLIHDIRLVHLLVCVTFSTNIPPIMIINRINETKNSVAVSCFLPGRVKNLSAPIKVPHVIKHYMIRL